MYIKQSNCSIMMCICLYFTALENKITEYILNELSGGALKTMETSTLFNLFYKLILLNSYVPYFFGNKIGDEVFLEK